MVTDNHYRWDFIGLSTDTKPTPETSPKVVNGSTYYCSDTSKLYVWYKDQWYERKPLGGGGGGGTDDFEQLDNRPKYNGALMTGSTDIPKVPGTTSELINDSGFITASYLPTVNDATLTITQNGTSKGTFTANDANDTTIALTDTTYTAGSNIQISANNEISATDTTYSDFTGTDGTAAGTAGLVPAPSILDTDKYLKSDGTWASVSGGGASYTAGDGIDITNAVISATNTGKARDLTEADYDWPTDNPARVALWKLPSGIYTHTQANLAISNGSNAGYNQYLIFIDSTSATDTDMLLFNHNELLLVDKVRKSDGYSYGRRTFLETTDVINNLTSTSTTNPLSAAQGKALKDLIDALDARVAALEGN